MKTKEFFILLIYCNSFIFIALSSDHSISEETNRDLVSERRYEQSIPKHFGWRGNLTRTFESNHEETLTRPSTDDFVYHRHNAERNEGNIRKEINDQWFYIHPLEHSIEGSNNHTNLMQFSGNRRRLSSKSCILPANRNRQKCLSKIKRRKINIPLNGMDKSLQFNYSLSINGNNIPVNSPVYLKNVSSSFNRFSSGNIAPAISDNNIRGLLENSSNPCTCYWGLHSCGCDCVGSLRYDDFQDISKGFFPCRNFTFTMTGGQYYALPPNFFSNIKRIEVFNLIISNSTFEYICDPTPMTSAFKGVKFSVSAIIKLKNVSVKRGWNWKPFEQLQSSSGGKVHIVFEDCKLRRLTSDFSNLAKGQVDMINISNSNLEMVGSNAFGSFVNMTSFRVPDNKIRGIRRSDFPEVLPKLVEIDLRNNQLRNLDDDLFKNMPFLKEISLSGNPLIVLSEKTFHDIIGQAHLEGLSDIPLYCDCRLQWLKESEMSNNAVIKQNMKGTICRRPSYLRGTPFEYLSKEHLICF